MSDVTMGRPRPQTDVDTPVLARLSVLDRFLPVSIVVAMYPVLAKVRNTETRRITGDRRLLILSLGLNRVVGPALMFSLGWLLAMVLVWNDLSCGDREAAAVLVAINSVLQIFAFAALGRFYLQVLPRSLGLSTASAHFSVGAIVLSVLVFLGIPLVAGFLTRTLGERARGRDWYENRFELAIAVCIGTFGVTSGQALAGVVGPLIEDPVLAALVYVALRAGRHLSFGGQSFPRDPTVPAARGTGR